MISELCSRVFAARNIAHQEHFMTRSYSAHQALGAFYVDVIEAVDAVTENYIGMYGPIEPFEVTGSRDDKDISGYLTDEADWIEANSAEISQGSDSIANLIQTLVSVYTKAVFMLRMR